MQAGQRKAHGLAFEIGKESIASFGFELSDLSAEKRIEIHAALPRKQSRKYPSQTSRPGLRLTAAAFENRSLYAALRP